MDKLINIKIEMKRRANTPMPLCEINADIYIVD